MTNKEFLEKLVSLRQAILADKKVDWTEAKVLANALQKRCDLPCVERVVEITNRALEDGVIDEDESDEIACELDILIQVLDPLSSWKKLGIIVASAIAALLVALFVLAQI